MFSLEAYKRLITEICSTMDNTSIEVKSGTVRLDYSGRGMYGTECLGIVLDQYDMDSFKVDFTDAISDVIRNSDGDTVKLFKKVKSALRKPSCDSMGLSVINYFPSIQIPSEYRAELKAIIGNYIYN